MPNVTIDKKQLPQVAVLGTVSVGLFGFFAMKMVSPPQTHAAPPPAGKDVAGKPGATGTTESSKTSAGAGATATGDPDASVLIGAAPPVTTMRDPFVSALSSAPVTPPKPQQIASATLPSAPVVPGLPGLGQVRPLPIPGGTAGFALPEWAVTGVICSDVDPSQSIAIFRRGQERRYVRIGSMVDDSTRLIGLNRSGVTVQRGSMHIHLPLGGPVNPAAPKPTVALISPTGTFRPTYGSAVQASAPPAKPVAPATVIASANEPIQSPTPVTVAVSAPAASAAQTSVSSTATNLPQTPATNPAPTAPAQSAQTTGTAPAAQAAPAQPATDTEVHDLTGGSNQS